MSFYPYSKFDDDTAPQCMQDPSQPDQFTTTALANIGPSLPEGTIVYDNTLKIWKGWNGSAYTNLDGSAIT